MNDEDDWHRAIDADHGLMVYFADWLDDRGDPRADGYRWLAKHVKWPHAGPLIRSTTHAYYDWYSPLYNNHDDQFVLPWPVWLALTGWALQSEYEIWREYPTRRAATEAVALVFARLAATHSLATAEDATSATA